MNTCAAPTGWWVLVAMVDAMRDLGTELTKMQFRLVFWTA